MKFKKGDYVRGIDSLTNICYTGRIIDIEYKLTDWASYCIDTVWGNKWLINDTIKKVEGENEMTFKKGDIVEVIEEDYSCGKVYEVGSRWEVFHEDTNNKGKPWDIVYVKDETRPKGKAVLFTSNVKKVEEGKLMNKQEIKEKLKENGAWCTECHTGEHGRYVEMGKAMELIEQLYEPQKPEELVTEQPDELMIPVSLVYQVLASEPTNREIKAFLKGYKEGLNNY